MKRRLVQDRATASLGLKVVRAGHFSDNPDHQMARDRPAECLVAWILRGCGWATTEGRRIAAQPGTLLTFRVDRAHAYGSDGRDPWEIAWSHFDGPAASAWIAALRRAGGSIAPRLAVTERLRRRFLEFVDAVRAPDAAGDDLATPLWIALMGLMRHQMSLPAGPVVDRGDATARFCAHVREHLHEPITIEHLAAVAHVSRRQLTRLTRRALGQSPMDYVVRQRMNLAATLLTETALPIKAVAGRVGYDDPYYFSRLFGARLHLSPSAYRDRHRSGDSSAARAGK